MICLTCHQNKRPKLSKDDSFIIPLGEISPKKKKLIPISHDKMTHLAKNCVTMNDLMDKFYEKTELSDVICEECSVLRGKKRKANSEKHQSVLNPPIQLRIFLQRSEYNFQTDKYCKNKIKFLFHPNIPCLFQVKTLK